jgi:hypothetical protein
MPDIWLQLLFLPSGEVPLAPRGGPYMGGQARAAFMPCGASQGLTGLFLSAGALSCPPAMATVPAGAICSDLQTSAAPARIHRRFQPTLADNTGGAGPGLVANSPQTSAPARINCKQVQPFPGRLPERASSPGRERRCTPPRPLRSVRRNGRFSGPPLLPLKTF